MTTPDYHYEARRKAHRLYCGRPTCRMVLATVDEDGILRRTPGWVRQPDGTLRLTERNRARLKRGQPIGDRRAYQGMRADSRSETVDAEFFTTEVFVCDLCPVRTRTCVDPAAFEVAVPWDESEDWGKF